MMILQFNIQMKWIKSSLPKYSKQKCYLFCCHLIKTTTLLVILYCSQSSFKGLNITVQFKRLNIVKHQVFQLKASEKGFHFKVMILKLYFCEFLFKTSFNSSLQGKDKWSWSQIKIRIDNEIGNKQWPKKGQVFWQFTRPWKQ